MLSVGKDSSQEVREAGDSLGEPQIRNSATKALSLKPDLTPCKPFIVVSLH